MIKSATLINVKHKFFLKQIVKLLSRFTVK